MLSPCFLLVGGAELLVDSVPTFRDLILSSGFEVGEAGWFCCDWNSHDHLGLRWNRAEVAGHHSGVRP